MINLKIKLFLAFFFLSLPIMAQNVKLGIGGGINYSMLSTKSDYYFPGTENIILPKISALADIQLNNDLWLSPSISYIRHGYSIKGYSDYSVKLNYLSIDCAIKYKFDNLYLLAGPFMELYLSGITNVEGHDEDIESDEMQSPNFGLVFGTGYDLPVSQKTDLFFQLSYGLGLTDIVKEKQTTLKTRGLMFQTGFKFSI